MIVREGRIEDAEFLAVVVTEALGHELSVGLAGSKERLPLVNELFTRLAADPHSQYSYKNALIALTDDGKYIGGIIAYDGSKLHQLRKAFIREANNILGWNVTEEEAENWGDEADAGEIYIDSLYVNPQFRKKGVATTLLKDTEKKFAGTPKPLGLLVEPTNHNAYQTYLNWGFKQVGVSDFFRTPMIHLQKPNTFFKQSK